MLRERDSGSIQLDGLHVLLPHRPCDLGTNVLHLWSHRGRLADDSHIPILFNARKWCSHYANSRTTPLLYRKRACVKMSTTILSCALQSLLTRKGKKGDHLSIQGLPRLTPRIQD